ncbi:cytochrome c oxidase subunit 4 [Arthrobacter rhombi]|uniref:cytochrome c oxidase subunit 4 n=1 Tax=Arthrobacter rhombi TaxID=71253 RepID=UPI003FD39D78
MKVETGLFLVLFLFFVPVMVFYGIMTDWTEWVGILALGLCAGLGLMVGFYLYSTAKRVGDRPEDRVDGEIHENAGVIGKFAPWSWWPLVLGTAAATGFLGIAVGFWVTYIGAGLCVIALVGWVYEYSRGDHAH